MQPQKGGGSVTGHGDGGPYEDPYSYEPSVAVSDQAVSLVEQQLAEAEQAFSDAMAAAPELTDVGRSARNYAQVLLKHLRESASEVERAAERARAAHAAGQDVVPDADQAIDHYATFGSRRLKLLRVVEAIVPAPQPPPEPPETVPEPEPWEKVSQAVSADVMSWTRSRRAAGDEGRMLVLKPTAGVGKTEAMIRAALDEHKEHRRVVFAARTKEVSEEIRQRIVDTGKRRLGTVLFHESNVHEIRGRDPDNCLNYENVQVAQQQGYAPGHSVCPGCDHFPDRAAQMGTYKCDYYESRIAAATKTEAAERNSANLFPIILTNHAALITAFQAGGGRYNKFWYADSLMIDEDPSEALEPTQALTEEQVQYDRLHDYPQHTYAARIFRLAIDMARQERARWEVESDQSTAIHTRHGSAYTGAALMSLLKAACESLHRGGKLPRHQKFKGVMRDAAHCGAKLEAGELCGLTSVDQANRKAPPRAIEEVAAAIYEEDDFYKEWCRKAHFGINQGPPESIEQKKIEEEIAAATTAIADWAYTTRLEYRPKEDVWEYVVESRTDLRDHHANLIVGDAYAQVDHYRDLFGKWPDSDGNDPVDVIDHVAYFEPNVTLHRLPLDSRKTLLEEGHLQENLAWMEQFIQERADGESRCRILVYTHQELIESVDKWLSPRREELGLERIEYEHYWGGRGKDQFKGYELTICLSEPIQNIAATTHRANARQYRAAKRERDRLELREPVRPQDFNAKHGAEAAATSYGYRAAEQGKRFLREHRRQNVAELAQALHRTRPVIPHDYPRDIVILGANVGLSADVLASTERVATRDTSQSPRHKGARIDSGLDGFFWRSEVLDFVELACSKNGVGFWIDEFFDHALVGIGLSRVVDNEQSQLGARLERLRYPPDLWPSLSGKLTNFWKNVRRCGGPWYQRGFQGERVKRRPSWQKVSGGRRLTLWFLPQELGGIGYQQAHARYLDLIEHNYAPLRSGSARGAGAVGVDFDAGDSHPR